MNGGIVSLIPLRSLTTGKTRLSSTLSAKARGFLTREMATRVIISALSSQAVMAAVVVSPDPEALAFASAIDPRVVSLTQPPSEPGLLAALQLGRLHAESLGASGLLVLFGDLPLLDGADVRNIVRRAVPVVIAPDRHGTGTNALLLRFSDRVAGSTFAFQFGEGSYHRHVAEADRLGLDVATSISAGTAFDLDTPADLDELLGDPRWAGSEAANRLAVESWLERAS
jgi:2-phospho-L-lactate/phosphoenolpyruvate guanylyltransferase